MIYARKSGEISIPVAPGCTSCTNIKKTHHFEGLITATYRGNYRKTPRNWGGSGDPDRTRTYNYIPHALGGANDAVKHLVAERSYSERGACQLVGVSRSSARYQPKEKPGEAAFRGRVRDLANGHPGYGYRRITAILRREGSDTNHKRVQRVWKSEGLQLPRRKPRKRRCGPRGEVIHKARYRNHVWSYDFLEEHTVKGNRLRILAIIVRTSM